MFLRLRLSLNSSNRVPSIPFPFQCVLFRQSHRKRGTPVPQMSYRELSTRVFSLVERSFLHREGFWSNLARIPSRHNSFATSILLGDRNFGFYMLVACKRLQFSLPGFSWQLFYLHSKLLSYTVLIVRYCCI